jgi:predicted ArsR family transcriptional regulator
VTDAVNTREDDAVVQARSRALSSPLRLRILRYCLHEAHSNREIAAEFDLNPGTSLHHVRTLVETGFLVADEPRAGKRGAAEIPYRATRRSWNTPVPEIGPVLVRTFLDEIADVAPDDLDIRRLGVMLNTAGETELRARVTALLDEFKDRPADADGRPISIMIATHPEVRKR